MSLLHSLIALSGSGVFFYLFWLLYLENRKFNRYGPVNATVIGFKTIDANTKGDNHETADLLIIQYQYQQQIRQFTSNITASRKVDIGDTVEILITTDGEVRLNDKGHKVLEVIFFVAFVITFSAASSGLIKHFSG
ncbi:MAG: hypothetical protein ACRBHB_24285 [Arenicella sp.]